MSRVELESNRLHNFNRLDLSFRPRIDVLDIDMNGSLNHEMAKMIAFYLIKKGITSDMVKKYFLFSEWFSPNRAFVFVMENGMNYKRYWERPKIVTEARFKNGRRADLFVLDTGEKFEIETSIKIKKPDSITIYV